jgi:hypothetical protein
MSHLSLDEANQLAALLNQICSLTMDALKSNDLPQRLEVATALREFHASFDEESEIAPFVRLLVQWLEGARPDAKASATLTPPFRRALQAMLQQVPPPAAPTGQPQEPISRRVLVQLISAVVAAYLAQEAEAQRQLAAQLVNVHGRLDAEWQAKVGPLLENLRAVLAGVDPHTLPPVPHPPYQQLWQSAQELLLQRELNEAQAHEQLLERLVHNARFTVQAKNEELTQSFLRSLLDVQRQALDTDRPMIATLVGAIRAQLQHADPTPFATLLEGAELQAWQKITED